MDESTLAPPPRLTAYAVTPSGRHIGVEILASQPEAEPLLLEALADYLKAEAKKIREGK